MALVRTDYGLIYNTDGSLCATLLPEGGVAVEEGTVNLVNNPTKWVVHSHPSYQESVDTGEKFLGCRVTKTTKLSTGSPPTQIGETLSIADGEIYTASVYAKITQKGNLDGARLIFYDDNTSQILAQTSSVKVGEWERLEVTYANNTGSTLDNVRVYYYPSRDVGDITYTAAPQLEQKPFATSFVDGTRAAGRLSYPVNFNMDEGTIHVWFYFNGTTAWNTLRGTIFRTKQGSGSLRNHFWLFTSTESGYNSLRFQVRRDDGSVHISENIKHFNDISDGWHSAVVRWSTSAQSLDVILDGQLLTSYTYPINGLLPFDAIDVGCRDTTDQSNTLIDELLILPYAVSPETVATWHSLDAPFYDPREISTAEQAAREYAEARANEAKQAAADAQSAADTANALLADIASDNKLTPIEKQATKKEWDIIVGEKPVIEAQATTYGITTEKTAYTTAYNALSTYITPLLQDLITTSSITGSTFRSKFKDYYDAKTVLLKKISDVAHALTQADIDASKRTIYAPGVIIDSTGAWGISGGVKQAGFGTDGKLLWGGGNGEADVDGLHFYASSGGIRKKTFDITNTGELVAADGYIVIDSEGKVNGRIISSGYFKGMKSISLGNYTVPVGKKLISYVILVGELGWRLPGSNTNKTLKYIEAINIGNSCSYHWDGGASMQPFLLPGTYNNLRVVMNGISAVMYGYTDGTEEEKLYTNSCYYEIKEVFD